MEKKYLACIHNHLLLKRNSSLQKKDEIIYYMPTRINFQRTPKCGVRKNSFLSCGNAPIRN